MSLPLSRYPSVVVVAPVSAVVATVAVPVVVIVVVPVVAVIIVDHTMPEFNFDRLNDENYHNWKTYMEAILIRKSLWAVVVGLERHPGGTEGNKKVRDFRTKQLQARAEIILHVMPNQLSHCSHEDPMIIWNTLADVHSPRGRSTIITLRRRLHKLHLERNEPMSAYVARARELARLLYEAGHVLSEDDLLLAITAGLPQSYNPFLISLDTLPDSEYTLDGVIPRIINEYTRQSLSASAPRAQNQAALEDAAMAVTTPRIRRPISDITCYKCNQKGHYQANCPLLKQNPADTANAVDFLDDDSF